MMNLPCQKNQDLNTARSIVDTTRTKTVVQRLAVSQERMASALGLSGSRSMYFR